jgi:integrase
MASTSRDRAAFSDELSRYFGSLQPDELSWLEKLIQRFPVPRAECAPDLVQAVARLTTNVHWWHEIADGPRFSEMARQLAKRTSAQTGPVKLTRADIQADYRGPFRLTQALLVPAREPVSGPMEALRASLVACLWHWFGSSEEHKTATAALGASIRGVDGRKLDVRLLRRLGEATTLEGFLRAASGLKTSGVESLEVAWRNAFEPELTNLGRLSSIPPAAPVAPSPEPPSPGPPDPEPPISPGPDPLEPPGKPSGPRPSGSGGKGSAEPGEDELIDKIQRSIRRGKSPRPPGAPAPEAGEPPEEVTPAVTVSSLPEAPLHEDASAVVTHQVRQAVWNTNYLLLPHHPDTLVLADYRRVVHGLLGLLHRENLSPELRAGSAGLLFQSLTGRTPRSLKALSILADAKAGHDPLRMDLLLKEGALRLSCFWQVPGPAFEPSYFRPDTAQEDHVEAIRQDFLLMLAPAFRDVLVLHSEALEWLVAQSVGQIESLLRGAAREVRESEGVIFTIGQLRASFSAHLYELSRDSAATQLICADTLGQSTAPPAYYAPRAKALAQSHWSFQQSLLGTAEAFPKYPLGDDRVGSRLLVRKSKAQTMARAPSRTFHYGLSRLIEERRLVEVHHAMVAQFAGMLMAVATHRPTEALLELTVWDFLPGQNAGAALFRDKIHDAAHDPRLVALPATLCRQFEAYLEHLSGLAKLEPRAKSKVGQILKGKAPLLMGLSDQGALHTLDLKALKALMPSEWQVVPMNWGRHWMRTHTVEQGLSPELVSLQLGHLEVVGYPFSGASPTEPWRFVEAIAPGWEQMARLQGWQVVRGLPGTNSVDLIHRRSLRFWAKEIQEHQAAQRAEAKRWRDAMKAKLREYREGAERYVIAHPELISAGIVARYQECRSGLDRHGLSRADFERIRDEVYESAGEDVALAIARANAVCHVAKVVNHRTRQLPETPGKVFNLRRPLDNAFFPGMMEAVRQIEGLREHLAELATQAPQDRWTDMASACACAALALVLFGYCESPDRIRGAIERRARMERSATLQDAILVPWGDKPHEVLGLRGIAAIVLARLTWKRGKDEMPPWDEVEARLKYLLPTWAIGAKEKEAEEDAAMLLERLCETAAVAHRYELSPAARRANARAGGATPAHMREQLALIDGDRVGSVKRDWEPSERMPGAHHSPTPPEARKGNARAQYNALCRIFPSDQKDTALPETGEIIPSAEAASVASRNKLIAEIQRLLEAERPERRLQPVVRMLASWVLDLIVNGTPKKDVPALVTVEDYLTRIGGPLVEIFGQSAMTDLDEAELEEAYLVTIECKESKSSLRQRTASAILLFHAFAQTIFELPEVDLSGVKLYLGDDPEALADARLVLPVERDAIAERLAADAKAAEGVRPMAEVRVLRQAQQAMPLFAAGGLRRGEGLGIQFRDVAASDGQLRVRIRPNSSRRLKTVRGRRVITLPAQVTAVGGVDLAQWVETERSRLKSSRLETAFVFTKADAPFDAKTRFEIADICLNAVREVTGRSAARLHAFRHLVATQSTTSVFLSDADTLSLSDSLCLTPVPTLKEVALPRDLLGQVVGLGHADPLTTLTHYHHVGWLLRSRSDARLAERYANRLTIAPLLGVSLHTLDWAMKKRPGRDRVLAWLDVGADVRTVPRAPASAAQSDASGSGVSTGRWTAGALGALLGSVARVGNLEKALLVQGAPTSAAGPLRLLFLPMEGRLGRRMLEEVGRAPVAGVSARRSIRRVGKGDALEVLWRWYDGDENGYRGTIVAVAEAVYEYLQPGHGDRILLPEANAEQLQTLIRKAGVPPSRLLSERGSEGIVMLRILRDDPDAGKAEGDGPEGEERVSPERYVGLVLKRILLVILAAARCD